MGWQVYMALILLIVWGGTLWCVKQTMSSKNH